MWVNTNPAALSVTKDGMVRESTFWKGLEWVLWKNMLRRSDLAYNWSPWEMGSTYFHAYNFAFPFYAFWSCMNKYLTRKEIKRIWFYSLAFFYQDLLEYYYCSRQPQSDTNCIRQRYWENFIRFPIPIQFPYNYYTIFVRKQLVLNSICVNGSFPRRKT